MQRLARIIRRASSSVRLDPALRRKVNQDLRQAGMDGNGSFRSTNQALAEVGSVLTKHGLEWDTTLNAHLFQGAEGKRSLDIAMSNAVDSMSPTSINNSMVDFSWYTRESGSLEILAMLS